MNMFSSPLHNQLQIESEDWVHSQVPTQPLEGQFLMKRSARIVEPPTL
jgi:hypothetical protein